MLQEVAKFRTAVEMTARLLLNDTDALAVTVMGSGHKHVVMVETNNPGAVIGRGGATVKALRLLAEKIGQRCRVKLSVEVSESRGGR